MSYVQPRCIAPLHELKLLLAIVPRLLSTYSEMILKTFSLAALCVQATATAVSTLKSQVHLLNLSASASRGYLAESEAIALSRVSEALHTIPVISTDVKRAITARIQAAQTVYRLMNALFGIYGSLRADAVLVESHREANPTLKRARNPMREDLTNALTRLGEGVHAIFKTLTSIHAQLPDWRGVGSSKRDFADSLKSLSRALRDLCQYPSLEASRVAFDAVRSNGFFGVLNHFQAHTDRLTNAQIKAVSHLARELLYRAIRKYNLRKAITKRSCLLWRVQHEQYMEYVKVFRDWETIDVAKKLARATTLFVRFDAMKWLDDHFNEIMPETGDGELFPLYITPESFEGLEKGAMSVVIATERMNTATHEANERLNLANVHSLHPDSSAASYALVKLAEAISLNRSYEILCERECSSIDGAHADTWIKLTSKAISSLI
jgi:hypothetical protein